MQARIHETSILPRKLQKQRRRTFVAASAIIAIRLFNSDKSVIEISEKLTA